MNSLPYELVSTEACFLLSQWIRAQLIHTKKPVQDLRKMASELWLASTFALIMKPQPLGSGNLSLPPINVAKLAQSPILGFKRSFIDHGVCWLIDDFGIVVFL